MKLSRLFVVPILFSLLFTVPVMASEKGMMGGKMMGSGMMGSGMMREKMMKHHAMMDDMMGMLKETMQILRNLSHKPDASQKKRLDEMIKKMDEMMKMHKEMMQMMEK